MELEKVSDDQSEEKIVKKNKKEQLKQKKNKQNIIWVWFIISITFVLSALFSLLANISNRAPVWVMFILLFLLLAISILFDMVGVAVTVADIAPFNAMASRKIKHAKSVIFLLKNADKVASICTDVIGDICGIVSGAVGVGISTWVITKYSIAETSALNALIFVIIGALISALTVGGKAACKRYAIMHSHGCVYNAGKVVSIFRPENKKIKNKKRNKDVRKD